MYKPFDFYVVRTPLFPLSWLCNLLEHPDMLDSVINEPKFQEAIYLASPSLFSEITKYKEGKLSTKDKNRIEFSIWKYIKRIGSRCTPFGLFSSFSLGHFDQKDESGPYNYVRKTRLDMMCLYLLAQKMEQKEELKNELLYFPNSTIFEQNEKLLYTEEIFIGVIKSHIIASVDKSPYLIKILEAAEDGCKRTELARSIVDDEISLEESLDFVNELIDNQILTSEFYPYLTGDNFLDYLIERIKKIPAELPEKELLTAISNQLSVLDATPLGESLEMYSGIEEMLKNLDIHIDRKYLFQCDLQRVFRPLSLNKSRMKEISEGLEFINKISFSPVNSSIVQFIERFQKRYDAAEVPLLEALDEKTGIGFKESFKDNFLLNGIVFPLQETKRYIEWGAYEKELSDKYINAIRTGEPILLTDNDFKAFKSNWDDLPSTISVFCELYRDDTVLFEFAGNSSAANLISRFGHFDEIRECLLTINHTDEMLAGDSILAEIVHIPFSRTGNVLQRPRFRKYEIPYLSNSFATRIFISDLMVSIQNGEIVLRSEKHNKRVIPILSTAHNFNLDSSLPVYNFLASIQTQKKRASLMFSWGGLDGMYNYYPRVQYKNIILSLAQWNVSIDEFEKVANATGKPEANLLIKEWRTNRGIPRYVQFCQGDNKLIIDLDSTISADLFLSELKKIKSVVLQEYPRVDHRSIIETDGDCFNNQFIFSFHKEQLNR